MDDESELWVAKGLVDRYGELARGFATDCAAVFIKYDDVMDTKHWQTIGILVEQLLTKPSGLMH